MVVSFPASKHCNNFLKCTNETKCAIYVKYIAHLDVQYFSYHTLYLVNIPRPVQYEIYTLAFTFDLRCQNGIYLRTI